MRVMAQLAMVMNLDKCIGCHTCSVTCKQAWTNRSGVEYVWFNNVETRPGQGYPRQYQDQDRWKGGWTLNKRGKLTLDPARHDCLWEGKPVKLTVTDNQGVSTIKTTNGHQVVRNGSAGANVSHAVTVKAKPLNTKAPTITGLFAVGQRITGNPGDWAGTGPITFKYQWLRCNTAGARCVSISGATARTRTISKNDQKHRLRIKVTASNSVGSVSENSAAGSTVASSLKFSFSLKAASPQNFKRSRYRVYETATCKVEACRVASTVTVRRPLSRVQRRRHTRLKLLTWRTNSTAVNKDSARSIGIIVPTRYRTAIKRSLRGRARARVSVVTKATSSTRKTSTKSVTFALKR